MCIRDRAWAQARPDTLQAVLRALLHALAWADAPQNRAALADLLARPEHVGVSPDAIAAGLTHIAFRRDGASRPEPAQAVWLLEQMRRWGQIAPDSATAAVADAVYRPDLHDLAAADA